MKKTACNFSKAWVNRLLSVIIFAMALTVGLSTNPVFAEIYKWQDENGQWHFSDQPPPESQDDTWWEEKGEVIRTDKPPTQTLVKDPEAEAAARQIKPIGTGVLWKIEGGGMSPSYVLGTIHSEDPRVMNFSPILDSAFDNKDVFLMEVVLDDAALLGISTATIFMDGRTLRTVVGDELFEKTARAVQKLGIPELALNKMKPWAAMSVLSVPPPKTGRFMDLQLYERAKKQGKQIVGLETVEEQVRVFDSMPMADQIALLREVVNRTDELPEMFERLIVVYMSGDLEKVASLAKELTAPEDEALTERVLKRLNEERNYRMVDRMLPHVVAGDAFVAVGALHLPGEKGILNLLKQKGFAVTPAK